MSQTIDYRVVEMKFDNKQFESGAATTMSTLDKLKKSLDFSKIGDSFKNIDKAADKVDISGIDKAINGVQSKFSALEVMAITTLGNITNSFVNSAKRWVSAFTIDPIKTGFQEYETQINAVQTILANTQKEGTNIKDVNAALDELNLYADKTIYNFTEMTRNIGTFTAAGVDLKTSVSAIQGIANLAAVSGSNSQQASTAMYQLSQALATGTVKLMDWNSVVNAGMGGQIFQDALKETSRLLGTGADAAIKAEGSFRESLKTGWLTSEVLTETLKKFTTSGAAEYVANYTGLSKEAVQAELDLAKSTYGEAEAIDKAAESLAKKSGKNKDEIAETLRFAQTAEDAATKVKTFTQLIDTLKEAVQSGWSQSFRIIIGDFEDAKVLFTEISDSFGAVISASADARNALLSEVFNKKDAQDYMADIVGVPKDAISELQTVAKEAGTTSDLFKDTLNVFTKGDSALNKVMTDMIGMVNSEKDVVTYISDITGMKESGIKKLQNLGKEVGYTSDEFKELANALAEGDPEMQATITSLLKMNEALEKPSGRELLIDSLRNGLKGLVSVIKPVQEAFREVFPPATADQIYGMLEAFHSFTETLVLSDKNSENLKKSFKGLFDIAKLLGDGFVSLLNVILPVSKPIGTMSGSFLELTGSIGEALSEFSVWVRSSENVSKAFDKMHSGVEKMSTALSNGIIHIKDFVKIVKDFPIVQNVISTVSNGLEELGNLGGKVEIRLIPFTKVMEFLLSIIQKAGPTVTSVVNGLGKAFKFLMDSIAKALGTGGFNSIYDLFNVAVLVGIGKQLSTFIKNLNNTVNSSGGFIDSIKDILSGVTDTFNDLQNTLKANTLKSIAISMALIAGSIFALSMIDSEKLTETLGAVTVLLSELTGIFLLLNKIDRNKKGSISGLNSLIAMAVSVTILAGALKKVSNIDSDKLLGSLGAISALLVEMTVIAIALSKYGGKVKTGVVGIIAFSAAIYILTSSVKKLGELDTDTLIKGLTSVGALLAELALFMMSSKFGSFKPTQAVSIVILSAALLVLQRVVEGFGSLNTEILLTGLIAVGAVLTEIAAFSLAAGESKHILKTSVSLVIMAKAIEMLQKPMSDFGNMDWSQIGKGLVAVGGALAEITLAMRLMPKNTLTVGVGLLAVAGSLTIIGKVVMNMSTMSWEEIGKGMVSLGGSLAILAIAMKAMKGTLGASAAMLVMATSLAILTPVLKSLGSMSWIEIAKGLTVLAGSFAVIGVAAGLLSPVIPAILGLSGAIALLGVAALAVGAGIFALSVGLATLAASGVAGAAALVQVVKILIVGVLDTISDSASAIGRVLKTLILTACDVIITCVPEIVKTILVVVKEVLTALADNAPEIVTQLLKLVIGIIDALAADLPTVIQSVMNLFSKFFAGIIQALNGMDTDVLVQTIAGVGLLAGIMLAMAALANLAPSAMIGVLAFGAIVAELAIVLAAVGALAQIPGLKWLINEGGELLEGVGTAIGKFIGGIVGGILGGVSAQLPQIGSDLSQFMTNLGPFITGSKMIDAESLACVGFLSAIILALTAAEVINGLASLFGLSLVDVAVELSNFMVALTPFIAGSKQLSAESMEACGYLAGMILKLTAANVISGIANFFGLSGSISDFGKELSEFGPYIKQFAEDVKDVKPEAVQGAAAAAEIMAEVAKKLPGTDGLVQKIFGEKSLAEFGEELVLFGPKIKQFGEMVKDVKPEAVEGAASAAEIMANLADKLPAQDGLLQKIMGEKSLSEFGTELVAFGPLIKQFADTVADINPESATGVASITQIMTTLANNLPSSDTLWKKLFGGGKKSISEFGTELVGFGDSMSLFSQSISGVDSASINKAITAFKSLVDLANYVGDASATSITTFATELTNVGTSCVDNFVLAFTNSTTKVTTGINTMITATLTAITNKNAEFLTKGTASANQYLTGMKNRYPIAKLTGTELSNKPLLAMQLKIAEFFIKGAASANQYLQGFRNKYGEATTTGIALANSALAGCQSLYSSFYQAGANGGQGFVDGLNSKMSAATSAGAAIGRAAYDAARKALDEHSPSKKMGEVGENAGLGFINKLMLYVAKAANAGEDIGKAAIDGTKSGLQMLDDVGYIVLHPRVIMDDVYSSVKEIEDLFNNAVVGIRANATNLNTQVQNAKTGNVKNNQDVNQPVTGGVTNYNFNQYNTSPKSLSRIEIYRQTNNQFRQFKEVTNPT